MPALNTVVILGSARNAPAHWGGPARLGTRVLRFVVDTLADRTQAHHVTALDPLELDLPVLHKPHHFYAEGEAPKELEHIAVMLDAADGFVLVSPEYNHSVPPALSNLLDHFGGSRYAYKPSGLVTYSAGQWGGVRAAMQLRALTSELGCLSVSRLCPIAKAANQLDEAGRPVAHARAPTYLAGMLDQFEWLAMAMKNHRDAAGIPR